MLHLSLIPAQVAGIIVVTCCEEVWQHCLETVLLEEKVTVPLSAQEHERQQCRLDKVFSGIAIDQAHEQNNASVKGDGGAVGLTENLAALRRWRNGTSDWRI